MKFTSIVILSLVILFIITGIITCVTQDTKISYVTGKVTSVESRITSSSDGKMETVHTILFLHSNGEEELFESRDNVFQGKFNNMELIQKLKSMEGKEITLKVSGYKKNFFFDYRNVIQIQ